jgi:predicted nucleotidyltransferase
MDTTLFMPREGDKSKISDTYLPIIEESIIDYSNSWNARGRELISLYVFGSVANGTATQNSDIDFMGVVDLHDVPLTFVDSRWGEHLTRAYRVIKKIPIAVNFRITRYQKLTDINPSIFGIQLYSNGACVYGRDITSEIRIPESRKAMMTVIKEFALKEWKSISYAVQLAYSPATDKTLAKFVIHLCQFYTLAKVGSYSNIYIKQAELTIKEFPKLKTTVEHVTDILKNGTRNEDELKWLFNYAITLINHITAYAI